MMPLETSCMLSFERVGMLYGESSGVFLGVSLRVDLYMTREDQVFVADVVVTDPTWETVASSVINQLVGVVMKFCTIVKICKYRGLHEGHHFNLMAMEVHDAPMHDMDHFIRE